MLPVYRFSLDGRLVFGATLLEKRLYMLHDSSSILLEAFQVVPALLSLLFIINCIHFFKDWVDWFLWLIN